MTAAIAASLIFIFSLALVFTEKLHRSIVAMAGAFLMVGAGRLLGFYSDTAAVQAIDFNTLGLLLGLMILVALLQPTGFFQFLAVWAGRLSRGRPIWLLVLLGTVTTVLSMFLPNVTTVVLIAPVTVLLCEILGVNPTPLLLAEALLANIGGVATLVGDPPNILIGTAAGFSFTDFLTHTLPITVVIWGVALWQLRRLFGKELALHPANADAVLRLDPVQALEDPKTARRVVGVLGAAIGLFFFQDQLGLSPAFIALGAATVALVLVRPVMHKLLERIEWSVLIFFAALFILVGGLEAAGVLSEIARLVAQAKGMPPVLFGIAVIWIVAALSAVIDNVPITMALIPVVKGLGAAGFNATPLWWALALGAGLGGNATIIGSTANMIVASLSERTHTPITSKLWNRRGLPVTMVTCAVASLLYAALYFWLQ
jgi:Na+/H+ antiporter NhaD/arsenite permease-like protein